MRRYLLLLLSFLPLLQSAPAQNNNPALSEPDRIRVAEAFRLGDAIGNKIWIDWSQTPFAVLLITSDHEFLIRHPRPSADFALIGFDQLLKSNVYFRKRVFQKDFLATFPVGGVWTVVVGQAENTTAKTSTPWVVTLLHEHFHQLQDSRPGMIDAVAALNLTRGDTSGMWMLNYAFPYESADVAKQAGNVSSLLLQAIESRPSDFQQRLAAYLTAREQLKKMLNADDYKYLSFQLWKEGIARYTEYHVAKFAAEGYVPSKEFQSLPDYSPFKDTANSLLKGITGDLGKLSLESYKRVAFYSLGAGEGLLLDRTNPNWRERYFTDLFFLEKYYKAR